jgi:hypothetical protein
MTDTPNPTTPGAHNHVGGPKRLLPLSVEGLMIEDGHGHLELEQQLAEHVLRIWREDGDAAWGVRDRLLIADGVNRSKLELELMARELLQKK